MRKLRVFESVSVDGYFADARGDISWSHAGKDDPEFAAWVDANATSGAELLFGRKTYEMMASFWPTPAAARQMPKVAKGMNAAIKHVASRKKRLELEWSHARRLEGDLRAAVRKLKKADGPGITVLGSGSIAQQLGEAGLVDEWQFVVVPVALGSGRTVFRAPAALRLVDHRVFGGGNYAVTYAAK